MKLLWLEIPAGSPDKIRWNWSELMTVGALIFICLWNAFFENVYILFFMRPILYVRNHARCPVLRWFLTNIVGVVYNNGGLLAHHKRIDLIQLLSAHPFLISSAAYSLHFRAASRANQWLLILPKLCILSRAGFLQLFLFNCFKYTKRKWMYFFLFGNVCFALLFVLLRIWFWKFQFLVGALPLDSDEWY